MKIIPATSLSAYYILLLLCYVSIVIVEAQKVKIDSTFGKNNVVVNDFVQYNFPVVIQQTPCTVQISFDYNVNPNTNASVFSFVAESLSPNPFGNLHTPSTNPSLKIYGFYKLSFSDFDPSTGSLQITVALSNPTGFLNVNPFSMVMYKKADATLLGEFVDAESVAFSDSVMMHTYYNSLLTPNLAIVGLFGDLSQSVQSRINKANTVPGPTTFLYDIHPSFKQSILLSIPNQKPSKTPPTFTLSEFDDFSETAVPKGYVALHSYKLSTSIEPPNFAGSTWSFNFDSSVGFTLNDDKTMVDIQPSSLACACTANSDEVYQLMEGRVSTDKLTCKIEDATTCTFPIIIAKLAPSASSEVQITDMTIGQTFRERIDFGNKKLFKIVIPAGVKFTISAKSLYQGEECALLVNSRVAPSDSVHIAKQTISNKESTITIENKEVGPLDYFISISPVFGEGAVVIMNVDYSSTLDQNAVIILAVTIPLFCLVLVVCLVLMIVLCRKRKNKPVEQDLSMFHKLQDQ